MCRTLGDVLYCEEQKKKQEVLHLLLEQYNDGRKKTLFCAAVNLLDWEALEGAMNELAKQAAGLIDSRSWGIGRNSGRTAKRANSSG